MHVTVERISRVHYKQMNLPKECFEPIDYYHRFVECYGTIFDYVYGTLWKCRGCAYAEHRIPEEPHAE